MLTPKHMAEQLLRYWSSKTTWSGGLRFCEPGESVPSNLYAAAIPQLKHRLVPAASLRQLTGPAAGDNSVTSRVTLQLVILARTEVEALMVAGDFNKHIFPSRRSAVLSEEGQRPMVVGVAEGSTEAWRFIELELVQEATPFAGPGMNQRTDDGHAGVQITFEALAVEQSLAE